MKPIKKQWKKLKKYLVKVLSEDEAQEPSQQTSPQAPPLDLTVEEQKQQQELLAKQMEAEKAWRAAQKQMEQQMSNQPQQGLNCPECGTKIPIKIHSLLSAEPIECPGCKLVLHIDQEQSQGSLDELRKLNDALEKAEKIQETVQPGK